MLSPVIYFVLHYDPLEFTLKSNKIDHHLQISCELLLDDLLIHIALRFVLLKINKEYLIPYIDMFRDKGIEVRFKDYREYRPYDQFSYPFQQRVSILDMIAHLPYHEIGNFIWT